MNERFYVGGTGPQAGGGWGVWDREGGSSSILNSYEPGVAEAVAKLLNKYKDEYDSLTEVE